MTGRVCAAGGCAVIVAKVKRIDDGIKHRLIKKQESFDLAIEAAEKFGPELDKLWDKIVAIEDNKDRD